MLWISDWRSACSTRWTPGGCLEHHLLNGDAAPDHLPMDDRSNASIKASGISPVNRLLDVFSATRIVKGIGAKASGVT
jgi:hypothetical protein